MKQLPRKINKMPDKQNPSTARISDPTLKAILKYKNHPSIAAIRNANNNFYFRFNEVSVKVIKR